MNNDFCPIIGVFTRRGWLAHDECRASATLRVFRRRDVVECLGWEDCLDSLLGTLDQSALRAKENKSAVGFTRKYLASLNPSIAEACLRSIHLADSVSTRGLEDRSESLIDTLDSLPFIVSTVEKITCDSRIEQTLVTTCFLLTKAMLGHETILSNLSTWIPRQATTQPTKPTNGTGQTLGHNRPRRSA